MFTHNLLNYVPLSTQPGLGRQKRKERHFLPMGSGLKGLSSLLLMTTEVHLWPLLTSLQTGARMSA